jgi:hypothetical protein
MDTTRPAATSQSGFRNEYEWSTDDVIRKLAGLTDMYQLGVLAKIKEDAGYVQKIVPVVFYHASLPRSVPGYLFTFVTPVDANIKWELSDAKGKIVSSGAHGGASAGDSVEVHWKPVGPDGWYKLSLHAAQATAAADLYGVVQFYHCSALSN